MRISDWSSDVCSSDLLSVVMPVLLFGEFAPDAATGAPLSEALDLWTPPTYLENPVDGVLTRRGGASLTISATLGAPAGSDEAIGGILIAIGRASCRERVCQYV